MLPSQAYRRPDPGAVLAALHEITTQHGYLPADALRDAAAELGMPLSQMSQRGHVLCRVQLQAVRPAQAPGVRRHRVLRQGRRRSCWRSCRLSWASRPTRPPRIWRSR